LKIYANDVLEDIDEDQDPEPRPRTRAQDHAPAYARAQAEFQDQLPDQDPAPAPGPDVDLAPGAVETSWDDLWEEAYSLDPTPSRVLQALQRGDRRSPLVTLALCREENNRLVYQDRIYVPESPLLKLRIIQEAHDTPVAGHPGRAKTLELITRKYYWASARKDVDRFCRNCHICSRTKASRHAPYGILRPLPVPDRAWEDLSMDFVVGLPWSNGFDAMLVVVDRLTKETRLVSCRETCTAEDLAGLFIRHVFRTQGLPRSIISDRGP
jgi:Integrase zinc binding domain